MTRLTQEEIEKLRVWADGAPRPGLAALVVRALDELESHRAREASGGVVLSEESVDRIRNALEAAKSRLLRPAIGNSATDDIIAEKFCKDALALLPPKREPTLLEAAKAVTTTVKPGNIVMDTRFVETIDALRAAIERESKR